MARVRPLNRRTILRGAFGAAMSLPFLEIMLGSSSRARAAPAEGPPKRYVVTLCGMSMGADGDPMHNDYVPEAVGPGYDAASRTAIAPLAAAGVADAVTVVSGLGVPYNTGPGHWRGSYHGGNHSPLLAGVPRPDGVNGAGIAGITSDQIVASAIAGDTLFPSVQYAVQAKAYSPGPQHGGTMSMRRRDDGSLERLEPTISPRQAYESLFFGFSAPEDEQAKEAFELSRQIRVSVLDACQQPRQSLEKHLGARDRQILEQYYEHCRSIERRLEQVPPDLTGSCRKPEDPGEDPVEGADTDSSLNGGAAPGGTGWSDETLRGQVHTDLVSMALACDLTRVATILYTRNQCMMSAEPITGHLVDLHTLSHKSGGSPSTTIELSRGIAWHVEMFARMVKNLRDMTDAFGNPILDDSVLVFLNEGGHGADPNPVNEFLSTNSAHSMENMACLIAGGAGGLKQGHHVKLDDVHPAHVLISAMNAAGVNVDQLGEVQGSVPELFA